MVEAAGALIGEDGLASVDRRYCFGASGAMWSDDMVSGFVICSFAACFVVIGLFVVPIWSDDMWSADMWSADIASGFAARSSAKAILLKVTMPKATKAAAPMKIFSLEVMECTFSRCGRGGGIGPRPGLRRLSPQTGHSVAGGEIVRFAT